MELDNLAQKWKKGDTDEREDLVKAMVRKVISNVDRDSSGTIEVDYIADKQLKADWQKINSRLPNEDNPLYQLPP